MLFRSPPAARSTPRPSTIRSSPTSLAGKTRWDARAAATGRCARHRGRGQSLVVLKTAVSCARPTQPHRHYAPSRVTGSAPARVISAFTPARRDHELRSQDARRVRPVHAGNRAPREGHGSDPLQELRAHDHDRGAARRKRASTADAQGPLRDRTTAAGTLDSRGSAMRASRARRRSRRSNFGKDRHRSWATSTSKSPEMGPGEDSKPERFRHHDVIAAHCDETRR